MNVTKNNKYIVAAINHIFFALIAEQVIELRQALPVIFPFSSAPPKKLQDASKTLFHVL